MTNASTPVAPAGGPPTRQQVRRWRRYLADERAERHVYQQLAARRTGEDRVILLALADAELRHEQHWLDKLGAHADPAPRAGLRTRVMAVFARRFGSVFTLALIQSAEARTPYDREPDATATMAADERVHEEVVRSLATRSRARMSGMFRAAVFGANDGLVSNLALVLGVGATGVPASIVLATGVAGLLAGALSMAAGEYVSVSSQKELLAASTPDLATGASLNHLDVDANELALVYRARGMDEDAATAKAAEVLRRLGAHAVSGPLRIGPAVDSDAEDPIGSPWTAAIASFCFFAIGAVIPVLPWIFGMSGLAAVVVAAAIVGIALLVTGGVVGVLSGAPPWRRAIRQLLIGYGAAAVTYLLGLLFNANVG